ncbi:TNT domain-containing protein [Kitasatospora purpeofusca]|uniref:TNT domain-containing protein n=1 Tax=Kitasatospora purpeofusca TaxID=67352 RepID=UPI002A59B405|nr:TNT domain-containing protein [Kitasatospora purpeofusca]MDY0814096.1 TNT domain-containing protein [Kitasatospora purpeofusca]
MRSRHLAALSLAAALLVTGAAATQSAAATTSRAGDVQADPTDCPREQYRPTAEDKKKFYCGFKELGPRTLPAGVAKLLKNYDRFGGLTPQQFLSWYRDGLDWKYPAEDGFRDVNGTIDRTTVEIPAGTKLDRFGLYYGRYLSKPGTSFPERALPPDSLNPVIEENQEVDSYFCYGVRTPFKVEQGGIASGFAQPGKGVQQYLNEKLKPAEFGTDSYNVKTLLDRKYLEALPDSACLA